MKVAPQTDHGWIQKKIINNGFDDYSNIYI